jgi:hypothetical protein
MNRIFQPSINQDLLIANVSEKIFYDYQSIVRELNGKYFFLFKSIIQKRNIDQNYQQDIHEVFNQYKTIISSRAASGDVKFQMI